MDVSKRLDIREGAIDVCMRERFHFHLCWIPLIVNENVQPRISVGGGVGDAILLYVEGYGWGGDRTETEISICASSASAWFIILVRSRIDMSS